MGLIGPGYFNYHASSPGAGAGTCCSFCSSFSRSAVPWRPIEMSFLTSPRWGAAFASMASSCRRNSPARRVAARELGGREAGVLFLHREDEQLCAARAGRPEQVQARHVAVISVLPEAAHE